MLGRRSPPSKTPLFFILHIFDATPFFGRGDLGALLALIYLLIIKLCLAIRITLGFLYVHTFITKGRPLHVLFAVVG
jgi:hypothetical protein